MKTRNMKTGSRKAALVLAAVMGLSPCLTMISPAAPETQDISGTQGPDTSSAQDISGTQGPDTSSAQAVSGTHGTDISGVHAASVTQGSGASGEISRIWDFAEDSQGWVYDDSWAGDSYTGGGACEYDPEKQMLRLSLDYSLNKDNGYSQTGISLIEEGGIDYTDFKALNFDLYYDPEAYSTGQLTVKAFANNIFRDQSCNVNQTFPEDVDGLKLVSVTLGCDPQYTLREQPEKLMIQLIGNNSDYHGYVWIDNISLSSVRKEKFLKESTIPVHTDTVIGHEADGLVVNGTKTTYAGDVQLADPQADAATVAMYQYLKAVGESEGTLFGHMEDTVLKAGAADLSDSDTRDVTGSLAAIIGMDCGGSFSGFASKYNSRYPEGTQLPDTNEGNIRAAALFSNRAIAEGGIITLSSHMPNFSGTVKLEGTFDKSYDNYDFRGADSYNLTGNCMNEILPGGLYHDAFRAHLDLIADYVSQVEGPVLFRPFHENTGSWFWWGKAFCDSQTYKNVFKYTVEYLRDERGIHNLLYLYGPGSEASTAAEYEERYPGDEYVDMVGFDTYDNNPVPDEEGYTFLDTFENTVKLTDAFAKDHGKLFAVTETGMSFARDGGITEAGNRRPEWYTEILDIITKPEYDCCYFMLWSNYSRAGGYYTPFVTEMRDNGVRFGHELLDPFISMYNNRKSIFASDQAAVMKDVLAGSLKKPQVKPYRNVSGYITAPVSGTRLLDETLLTARLNQEVSQAQFKIRGNGQEAVVDAMVTGRKAEAVLAEDVLAGLGEAADGTVTLYADGEQLQELSVLLNIEPRPEDPLLVDDFESYAGLENLLVSSWSSNKDGGCEARITLSDRFSADGSFVLQFDYTETRNGWAGCEFAKETDWSDCNALQFWVMPDGNNQKTVMQIKTTSGGGYEAYLQEYAEYAQSDMPLLVTLPFEEFVDKNGRGPLTSEAAAGISGFGIWINAIPDSPAMGEDGTVTGTMYYDEIRAVKTTAAGPVFEKQELSGEAAEAAAGSGADTEQDRSGSSDQTASDGGNGENTGNADGKKAASTVTAGMYVVPVVSGMVAVMSLICLVLLALGKRRKD